MGLIILAIIAILVFITSNNSSDSKNTSINNQQVLTATPSPLSTNDTIKKIVLQKITLTSTGFEPKTLKVKKGTRVVWSNKSGSDASVNSDPHPTHFLWPFLNLGRFGNNENVETGFDEIGTFTYHNHLNPNQTGQVIVE